MSTAPLLHATLGPEDRANLLRDLSALAAIESAQVEDAGGTRTCRLDEVFAAIEAGGVRRALLRYRYDGRTWFDTLIPEGEALRLVRVAEDDVLESGEAAAV